MIVILFVILWATESLGLSCANKYKVCNSLADTGKCGSNPTFMRPNCALACGFCKGRSKNTTRRIASATTVSTTRGTSSTTTTTTTRSTTSVSFWASTGECQRNPTFMLTNCRLSCSVCGGGRGISQRKQARDDPARCSALANQTDFLRTLRDENLVKPQEGSRFVLSSSLVNSQANSKGCATEAPPSTQCKRDICYNLNFRSMDGSCNNFKHPEWGAAFRPYERLLDPVYEDKAGQTVGSKGGRPSTRDVVRNLLSSSTILTDNNFNLMIMQWGQFIAHDISKSTQPNRNTCGCSASERCIPVPVSGSDQLASQFQGCVRVQRDHPVCGSKPREQLNENTAFLDGSHVYGSSIPDNLKLRDDGSPFMKTDFAFGGQVPPFSRFECPNPANCPSINFQTGDDRANIFVSLAIFHILFIREHNRIANILRQINPQWEGDRIFQEARKIVGAEVQAITYKEYLPKIFGSRLKDALGSYSGYDESVNPTVTNEFSAAAFRFGHGMLTDTFPVISANGASFSPRAITFGDWVEQSIKIRDSSGIDTVIRGLMVSPLKKPQRLAPATQRIFGNRDLGAINLQRGRDHGLPSYNAWREFCKLPKAKNFSDFSQEIHNIEIRRRMQELYHTPDNVDLYAALLLEDPVPGALVGPTLICLLGEQFRRLRDGDRFFFRADNVFSRAQRTEIERTSFARIICDNADSFQFVPRDAFRFTGVNGFTSCQQVPGINLQAWRE